MAGETLPPVCSGIYIGGLFRLKDVTFFWKNLCLICDHVSHWVSQSAVLWFKRLQRRGVIETCDLSNKKTKTNWEQISDLVPRLTIPDKLRNSNHDIGGSRRLGPRRSGQSESKCVKKKARKNWWKVQSMQLWNSTDRESEKACDYSDSKGFTMMSQDTMRREAL